MGKSALTKGEKTDIIREKSDEKFILAQEKMDRAHSEKR